MDRCSSKGPASPEHPCGDAGGRYKWVALSNTTLGTMMATIDTSIMLIAMPDVFRGIHLDPLAAGNSFYLLWMILGFQVVTAVLVLSFGRLGDIFGRVRMYNLGFAAYTAASLLLAVTWMWGSTGATVARHDAPLPGRWGGLLDGQLGGHPRRRLLPNGSAAWPSASTRWPA